jgi:MYXO-CTERM domain-containing protein
MSRICVCVAIALATATSAHAESIDNPRPTMEPGVVALTSAQRKERAAIIRDTAAAAGMTNAALLAGIGEVETNFAHCWSEATWACQGPASSSCGGGPVIAGSADGPCSYQQGGLGMFQFDSGTYSQTLSTYGPTIVTMQGNVDAVIPFLVTRAIQSVDGVNNAAEALAWMNSIKIQDGDPQYEDWLYFVSWRYNGCMGCTTQQNKYRAGTNKLRDEFGADFWKVTSQPPAECSLIPAGGRMIDDKDTCFSKGGGATSWYPGAKGENGSCWFTYTTDDPQPDNNATWTLAFEADGRYLVEVNTDASLAQSQQAKYTVTHAGGTTDVVIDQSAMTGYQSLGEFDFVAGETFSVHLADNTGEAYVSTAKIAIMFDAVRVTPRDTTGEGGGSDGMGEGDDDSMGGGCSTTGGGSPFVLLLVLGALVRRIRK